MCLNVKPKNMFVLIILKYVTLFTITSSRIIGDLYMCMLPIKIRICVEYIFSIYI